VGLMEILENVCVSRVLYLEYNGAPPANFLLPVHVVGVFIQAPCDTWIAFRVRRSPLRSVF